MNYIALNEEEMANSYVGEAITIAAVMAIACIAIMAVVLYKLYRSKKGGVNVPGGWKFTWD